jgi:hypothetical protein
VTINPAYIDVAIPRGCLRRESKLGESEFPNMGDTDIVAIPRSEWKGLLEQNQSLELIVQKIKDQNGEGSCASNATCQCFEINWNMMLGIDDWLEMSPISIYRWVANSPNNGSTIEGNLRQLRDVGCLPVNSQENIAKLQAAGMNTSHVLKAVGYYQRFPNGWEDSAKNFRATEWFEITSFDEFITCLFYDFPVCYGRAGHAICGVTPVFQDNQWHVKYANSWKPSWGDNGYGYDSERYISGSISSYGAWGLRAVTMPEIFLP